MSIRKKWMIVFLTGLFLMGIGSGIAFAELSTFQYGGMKSFGTEERTETIYKELPEDTTSILLLFRDYDAGAVRVEEDDSMADDKIAFEVTYNDRDTSLAIQNDEEWYDSQENRYRQPEAGQAVYTVNRNMSGTDDIPLLFRWKDDVLEGIKNRTIYSYQDDSVREIVVKVPVNLKDCITLH